ncbi:hypothetical protein ACQ4M3_26560 [Leptolyngbya sp. AN03gr2]|uniref:hypothetical protein n=1 Tax=unclassified Leptolyngbya TaxID=2650499 RepID=UPI003D31FF96
MKSIKLLVLSSVMFGAGAIVSAVTLANLYPVNANPIRLRQQSGAESTGSIVEENGFRFDFQGCQRPKRGGSVLCNFLVTNLSAGDRWLSVGGGYTGSRIIDSSGNGYTDVLARVGTGAPQMYNTSEETLVAGVPTKLTMELRIPQEVTNFSLLEVAYNSKEGNSSIQLRNVSVNGARTTNSASSRNDCPPQTKPTRAR